MIRTIIGLGFNRIASVYLGVFVSKRCMGISVVLASWAALSAQQGVGPAGTARLACTLIDVVVFWL